MSAGIDGVSWRGVVIIGRTLCGKQHLTVGKLVEGVPSKNTLYYLYQR